MQWTDILHRADNGNPPADRRVEKTEAEWKALLTEEQFRVTRLRGTERAFTGAYCEAHDPGLYACVCCQTVLFDSRTKFSSGTGWPSFTEPVAGNVIKYEQDTSYNMRRIEVSCNVCDAHLGHVFPDGPPPTGLRFCINSAALTQLPDDSIPETGLATLGGGCFWCLEALFQQLRGVESVVSGYSGGLVPDPSYKAVSTGLTGHAEVVHLRFYPDVLSYSDLLRLFFTMHDPTTLNRQGADVGSQYRSVIFYHDTRQRETAYEVIEEMRRFFSKPIVTEMQPFDAFYPAEAGHQNYYRNNPEKSYCQVVIDPKLAKLRSTFPLILKPGEN